MRRHQVLTWVQSAYDANGNRQTRNLYYGANTAYDAADELNRIEGLTHTFVGGQTARFDYDFDVVSRLNYERRNSTVGDGYTYGLADQNKDFIRDGTWNGSAIVGTAANTATYSYDANGNRLSKVNNGTTINYLHNGLNQYYSISGVSPAPTYDANGNLQTYKGWTYTYDAMNRLIQANQGSSNVYFYYDGLNRQAARNVVGVGAALNVWDGWNVIVEYGLNDVLQGSYLYGAGQDELVRRWWGPNANVWYHQDGRGNTSHVSGDGGAILERYTYDLYGAPTVYDPAGAIRPGGTAYSVSHLFTGQRWVPQIGPSSMYDYRNRFMFPEIGRFIQTDAIGFAGGNHLYRYCRNNPTNWGDPFGLEEANSEENKPNKSNNDVTTTYTGQDPEEWQQDALDNPTDTSDLPIAEGPDIVENAGPVNPGKLGSGPGVFGGVSGGVTGGSRGGRVGGRGSGSLFQIDKHKLAAFGKGFDGKSMQQFANAMDVAVSTYVSLTLGGWEGSGAKAIGIASQFLTRATAKRAMWVGADGLEAAMASGAQLMKPSAAAIKAMEAGDMSLMQAESAMWAKGATGRVPVFFGNGAGRTFLGHELPQLLNNMNTGKVSVIDITF